MNSIQYFSINRKYIFSNRKQDYGNIERYEKKLISFMSVSRMVFSNIINGQLRIYHILQIGNKVKCVSYFHIIAEYVQRETLKCKLSNTVTYTAYHKAHHQNKSLDCDDELNSHGIICLMIRFIDKSKR